MTIYEKYGFNKMNLPYLEKSYKTTDLNDAAEEWMLGFRKALLGAMENGIIYFSPSSKEKVDCHVREVGGLGFLKREMTKIILTGEVRVDYLHEQDQRRVFGIFKHPWNLLCPIVFIFESSVYEGKPVYLKCRVASKDRLAVDVHYQNRTSRKYRYEG